VPDDLLSTLQDTAAAHVWFADLEIGADAATRFVSTLAPDERERAARFVFEQHRRYYVAGRGLLRRLLARYLHTEPGEIRFRYGSHGKPELDYGAASSHLRFNVSHSGPRAVFALAWEREIGADIERVRSDLDLHALAKTCFSRREQADIFFRHASEQAGRFFDYWTAKEACIKAEGLGLSLPLEQFSIIEPALNRPARVMPESGFEIGNWTVRLLPCEPGYRAAVALHGTDWVVKLFPEPVVED